MSKDQLSFEVVGRAQPGGSKRAFVRGKRAHVVDANKNVGAWKDRVALAASVAMKDLDLFEGPLVLDVAVFLSRPKGHIGKNGVRASAPPYPAVKPDLTKYVRAIEDAMTGIVWRDDSQVVSQTNTKRYATRDWVRIGVSEAV